ncbi:hypothetical protein [Oculatella sp. LEGE 06141]|nr:hypothetical protein [Oculatella sp. LEGE 06141]
MQQALELPYGSTGGQSGALWKQRELTSVMRRTKVIKILTSFP